MTGIMKDPTSRQHFVISRLRFSSVISQKSKDVMFELDYVNLTDNAKKKSYDNFMSFGLYSGILRNIQLRKMLKTF